MTNSRLSAGFVTTGHPPGSHQVATLASICVLSCALAAVALEPQANGAAAGAAEANLLAMEIVLQNGHSDEVSALSYSADGHLVVSGSKDHSIKIWRTDGALLRTLRGHEGAIRAVDFSREGDRVVSGSEDGTVRIWKVTGGMAETWKTPAPVYSVAISPREDLIASGGRDGVVRLWTWNGREAFALSGLDEWINRVEFSPDGALVAASALRQAIMVWRVDGEQVGKLQGNPNLVNPPSFAFDTANGHLVYAFREKAIHVQSVDPWRVLETIATDDDPLQVAISPKGDVLATSTVNGHIHLLGKNGKRTGMHLRHVRTSLGCWRHGSMGSLWSSLLDRQPSRSTRCSVFTPGSSATSFR